MCPLCCFKWLAHDGKKSAPESTCWDVLCAAYCGFINTRVFRVEELLALQSLPRCLHRSQAGSHREEGLRPPYVLVFPSLVTTRIALHVQYHCLALEVALLKWGSHRDPWGHLPCLSSPLSDGASRLPCCDCPRSTGLGWRGSLLLGSRCGK